MTQPRKVAWENIAAAVQAASGVERTARECQKRWQTIQAEAKGRFTTYNEILRGTGEQPSFMPHVFFKLFYIYHN